MMFKPLAVVGVSSLFGVVFATTAPVATSGRTLHPNELWGRFGGTQYDERMCDYIGNCALVEECNGWTPGFDCRLYGREDVTPDGDPNTDGCNYTGNPMDVCEETGSVVCRERYRCKTVNEMCVIDTGIAPAEENAPESCTML